jgi:hypothetical protein
VSLDLRSGRVWVEPEHRGSLEAALIFRARGKTPFVIGLICWTLLFVAGSALKRRWLGELGASATTRALGILRANRLGRTLGALILAVGLLSLLRR